MKTAYEAIVIGGSSGSTNVLIQILRDLPRRFRLPLLVVRHIAADSEGFFAVYLGRIAEVAVKEAADKEHIEGGMTYIAPPGYHLLVEEDRTLSLSVDPPVNYARPSIDVLFESAADAFGAKLVGVILSGGSADGSLGLERIKDRGGLAIVQDPATAESELMPREAILKTLVDYVLRPEEIGPFLNALSESPRHRVDATGD